MMQQQQNQPEVDEDLEFDAAADYVPPEGNNVDQEPNYAAGLAQNLDEIALAHQLQVEE